MGDVYADSLGISTHAPRTGSDGDTKRITKRRNDFNPRSPHGERQAPTRPAPYNRDISTHAPRTGSDCVEVKHFPAIHISTHAPRTGSDLL